MYSVQPLFFLICLSFFQLSFGQEIIGIATYKSFLAYDLRVDSTEVDAELRGHLELVIGQQTQKEYELHFNSKESLFQEKDALEKPNPMTANVMVQTSGGLGSVYNNLEEMQYIRQIDLLGKLFLVTDSIVIPEWTLEKETKSIGEYTCFKASYIQVYEDDATGEAKEKEVVAWYTPQIPVGFGPMNYSGLPGLILEVRDGKWTYLCNQIVLNPKNPITIGPARKGKVVSKKEYDVIQEKKRKERHEFKPSSGAKSIEIRINN